MTSRLKEDERNERTIRNLLKLPENRRCINCNSLGPQYVCINFWTFVCTTCSGIHREFTHRVKSVSMAKFTSQEVTALQGGGNASAKEIYFKEWDPQRQSFPDSSNIERVRDFIRHVYVDKRYTGDKSIVGPTNEERRSEDGKSPDIMRPVRDILGVKVSPIGVIEPPKANGPLRTHRSSLESSNRNPVAEVRTESSLIDFDDTAQLPQIQQTVHSSIQPSTSSNNNWANFDSVQEVKVAHTCSNTNLLDALSELSVSVSVPPQSSPFGTTSPILAPAVAPVQSFIQTDVKSAAKKELPADLFTLNYSSFGGPGSGPGWFPAPPQYGMGFNMQYNVPVHMPPAYLQPSKPLNPFDAHGSSSIQFPLMAPLQGALPPSGIQSTSSLGAPSPAWMHTQPPVSPQLPIHGQFMGQIAPNMPPHPRQQVGGFGLNNISFRSVNHNQQQSRGNPFG